MSDPADGEAKLALLRVRLEHIADLLKEAGSAMNDEGALFIAGMIGAAQMIVEEIVVWITERQAPEEKPS